MWDIAEYEQLAAIAVGASPATSGRASPPTSRSSARLRSPSSSTSSTCARWSGRADSTRRPSRPGSGRCSSTARDSTIRRDSPPGGRARRAVRAGRPHTRGDQPAHVDLRDGPGRARDGAGRGRVDDREARLARGGGRRADARRLARHPHGPACRARRRGTRGVDGRAWTGRWPCSHRRLRTTP